MLVVIEEFISIADVKRYRAALDAVDWADGSATAGSLAATVKHNQQLPDSAPQAVTLGNELLSRMGSHPTFVSAVMPMKIHPPRFNRYGVGQSYGAHVDGSVMALPGTDTVLRSDVSGTLFLSDADDYEGGELIIETEFGAQAVKLRAGDLVLYPSGSLHRVAEVTRGQRLAAILWAQSMVKDSSARSMLFDLDQTIQSLTVNAPTAAADVLQLTSIYHNLVRRWADV
ncbi:MAG: Fe2+-dependent dioxygenase [Woeseia sp.]